MIAPHSFRVLKRDCLDLPEKIYQRVFVNMTKEQRRLYDKLRDELLIEWEGYVSAASKLTALGKLQQIVCGYLVVETGAPWIPLFKKPEDNPRIVAMMDAIEESKDQSAIIWARYREDLNAVAGVLRRAYGADSVVEYHGGIKRKERTAALAKMQDRTARFFVGQQGSGGTGTTITVRTLHPITQMIQCGQ